MLLSVDLMAFAIASANSGGTAFPICLYCDAACQVINLKLYNETIKPCKVLLCKFPYFILLSDCPPKLTAVLLDHHYSLLSLPSSRISCGQCGQNNIPKSPPRTHIPSFETSQTQIKPSMAPYLPHKSQRV